MFCSLQRHCNISLSPSFLILLSSLHHQLSSNYLPTLTNSFLQIIHLALWTMADIDPYAVLGVARDASLPEIKSAHRKRVLKCHPDKIKEESLRNQAQDEFQRVQQAYETLSDPSRRTKHDQKVRLAELRREMKGHQERSQARANAAREYRDGRIYEERTPAAAAFGDDDESDSGDGYGGRYEDTMPEEPRATPTNRKYDDWGSGRRTSRAEERKKPSTSTPKGVFSSGSPFRGSRTRDSPRDNTRTYHSSRAKYRTKERQREAYEKYAAPAADSDFSDSSAASSIYEQVKRSATESRRATPDRPRARPPADEDDFPEDPHKSKHDIQEVTAQDYIKRSKRTVPEVDPRHRPSRSPSGRREYESRRSKRSSETVRPSNSRSGSYEHLEPHPVPPPRLPREATSPVPGKYGSRPHPMRSATAAGVAGLSRSMRDPDLASYMRGGPKRQDSGYSSPGAADMGAHGTSPPKQSTRYKIVTVEPDGPPHSSPRYQQRGFSPPPPRSMPVRSKTFAPETSSSSRAPRATPATSATRPLFGQVDPKDIKYNREYGPDADAHPYRMPPRGYSAYEDYADSSPGRRQSAFA